jgi:hypothetical protein
MFIVIVLAGYVPYYRPIAASGSPDTSIIQRLRYGAVGWLLHHRSPMDPALDGRTPHGGLGDILWPDAAKESRD